MASPRACPTLSPSPKATTLPLLLSRQCVTPISQEMARYCMGMGLVDVLPVDLGFPKFEIGIITRRADVMSESVAQLSELLVASVRRNWPRPGVEHERGMRSDLEAPRVVA